MKIDNSINPVTTVSVNDGKRQTGAAPSTGKENGDTSVHISQNAAKMQSADNTTSSGAVVDTARVNEIKQAISEGTFKVNPEVVADKLLETVRELIQSKKGET